MPNNDLGTAHGRIQVSFDDRGSAAATAALIKMQRQFDQMNKNLVRIEKSLKNLDSGLESTEVELERNTRATRRYSASIFDAHKSVARFSKDTRDLQRDLKVATYLMQTAKDKAISLGNALRFLNNAGGVDMNRRNIFRAMTISFADLTAAANKTTETVNGFTKNVIGWTGTVVNFVTRSERMTRESFAGFRSGFTLITSGFINLKNKIAGVGDAFDSAPSWVAKLMSLVKATGLLASGMGFLAAALGPFRIIERFARSNVFSVMASGANRAAGAFENFGISTTKYFKKDITVGLVSRLRNFENAGTQAFDNLSVSAVKFSQKLKRGQESLKRFAASSKELLTGIALFTSSIKKLWGRLAWFFKLPKPILASLAIIIARVLPSALNGLRKALQATSNAIVGLYKGSIQLGRGLTVLPGLISSIIVGVTTLRSVFTGLGTKLKDLFSDDPFERLEALTALPENLKPLGKALLNVSNKFREIQTTLQNRLFENIQRDIQKLSNSYFPLFERGTLGVVNAFKAIKDASVSFALTNRTRTDVSGFYDQTAGSLLNLAKATRPAAEGFRDMAVIGNIFIRQMTGLMPALTSSFAGWAKTNRENGNMMRWMYDSAAGAYDLVRGLSQLTRAAYTVVTVFSTGGGDLGRFADYMERLNKKAKESMLSGWLFKIRNAVRTMGADKMEQLRGTFETFTRAVGNAWPFVTKLSESFSSVFIPILNRAIWVIENFLMLLENLGLSGAIGWALGFAYALRAIPKVWSAILDGLKIFAGSFLILKNRAKVVGFLENAFAALGTVISQVGGRIGGKVGDGIGKVNDALAKGAMAATTFIAALSAIATVAVVGFAIWENGRSRAKAFENQIKANSQSLVDFKKNLVDAFTDDGSFTGRSVMETIRGQVQTMITGLNDVVDKAPNMGDHLYDWLFRVGREANKTREGFLGLGETAKLNSDQVLGEQANKALNGLKKLREAGIDIANVIAMTDADFARFIDNQNKLGEEAQLAAKQITQQRQAYISIKEDMQQAGPAAVMLADGVKKIAEAGGDATSKLDGLRQILEALGILKTSALDAAMAYEQGLADIVTKVDEIASSAGGLNRSVLMTGDTFNKTTQAGRDFYQELRSLGDEFMGNVSAGASATEEYQRFEEQLNAIAIKTGLTIEEIKKLATQVGVAPDFVGISMSLVGTDKATQDLFIFLSQAQMQANDGIQTPVKFRVNDDPAKLAARINEIVGASVASVSGTNVEIGAALSSDQILKIQNQLATALPGVQLPGMPPPPPPKINPVVQPPKALTGVLPGGHGARGNAPPPVIPPVSAAPAASEVDQQVENAKREVEELKRKIEELNNKNVIIDVEIKNLDKFNEFHTKLGELSTKISEVFDGFTTKTVESTGASYLAIENFVNMAVELFGSQEDEIYQSGRAFVEAFARGIRDNPAAYNELNSLLTALKEKLHSSPPKEGPLSERGDAVRYGGKMFVSAYASGISSSALQARDAVNSMAEGALGGLPEGRGVQQAGEFLGQISRLVSFFSNAVNAFTNIAESVLNFTKYMSDPKGEGSFFGRSTGFKRVLTDAQLQRQRDDADQQAFRNARESEQRNTDEYDRRLEIATNAQNAVADQSGYESQEAPKTVGAMIKAAFPEIASIGGARADSLPFHREGNALDIMIPDYNTPEGKALGDKINAWALANAKQIGLVDTIWQDFWQPADGSQGNFMGNKGDNEGHFNHIHLTFAPGASVDMSGIEMNTEELAKYQADVDKQKAKDALQRMQDQYGPPILGPDDLPATEQNMLRYNDQTGNYEVVTPHGTESIPGPGTINFETGQPWTPEESLRYAQENPMEVPLPEDMTLERFNQIQNSPEQFTAQTAEESMAEIAKSNSAIARALEVAENPLAASQDDIAKSLTAFDEEIIRLRQEDTAGSRAQISDLSSIQSDLMSSTGFAAAENPIDTITGYLSAVTGIASDVFGAIGSGIEAIGGTKAISETLVRGVQNTEDVFNMIDEVQKFIDFGSQIASAAGNIVSVIGSFTASQDYGMTAGIGALTSLVGGVMQGANAVIDLAQEAYRIVGSYVGDFLGYLVGGAGGQLEGNVKFLLDQRTNQLLAYGADNPQDKRTHNMAFQNANEDARNQLVGNINVYGGPGSDPRDNTRQMMFQIKQAQMTQATSG